MEHTPIRKKEGRVGQGESWHTTWLLPRPHSPLQGALEWDDPQSVPNRRRYWAFVSLGQPDVCPKLRPGRDITLGGAVVRS